MIQIQVMPGPPRDEVIRARGVPAHAEASNNLMILVVEGQATTKHIDAADFLTNQRILRRTVIQCWPLICYLGIYRVTFLQPEQAASRLDG